VDATESRRARRQAQTSPGGGVFTAAELTQNCDRLARIFSKKICRERSTLTGRSGPRVSEGSRSLTNRNLSVSRCYPSVVKCGLPMAKFNLPIPNRDLSVFKSRLSLPKTTIAIQNGRVSALRDRGHRSAASLPTATLQSFRFSPGIHSLARCRDARRGEGLTNRQALVTSAATPCYPVNSAATSVAL
jgi:hypothetical protein